MFKVILSSIIVLSIFGQTSSSDCLCGLERVKRRIIDGQPVQQGKYPWMVMVGSHNCGGSLISDRHILTAAHCTEKEQKSPEERNKMTQADLHDMDREKDHKIVVGAISWKDFHNQPGLKVKKAHVHPKYKGGTNDLAIIELEEPIDFAESGLTPVCLPDFEVDHSEDTEVIVAGWGYVNGPYDDLVESQELMEVRVPVTNSTTCKKYYPNLCQHKVICYSTEHDRKGSCAGDSGSPIMYERPEDGHIYQISVHSMGMPNCNLNTTHYTPRVGERIVPHLDWIKDITVDGKFCDAPKQAISGDSQEESDPDNDDSEDE